MTKVSLFKQDGSQIGEIELNAAVFGVEPNEDVIFDAVIMQRASLRQGTHAVKNRSPQWVGGGTVFGPTPRSYSYKLPKKVRRLALQSVLSQKVLEGKLVVVDELSFAAPSTKEFKSVLNNLKVDAKTLLVLEGTNANAYFSARNLANVKVIDEGNVNVLDVVNYDTLVITKAALSTVEEALA